MHHMERKAELVAIVRNSVVRRHDLLELALVALMARIGFADIVQSQST